MAKRFTDTEKWKHPQFRKLPMEAKLAWLYLLDNCDHAGMWLADFELMSFQLGFEITKEKMAHWFGEKLYQIGANRIFVPNYLDFQYGKTLDRGSRSHVSAQRILDDFGIILDALPDPMSITIHAPSMDHSNSNGSATNTNTAPIPATNTDTKKLKFDFQPVYDKYPRKEKKSVGFLRLKSQIKTQADYDLLLLATERYAQSRAGKDPQFTMQFSTFVSEWRDWLEKDTGTVVKPEAARPAWELEAIERDKRNAV